MPNGTDEPIMTLEEFVQLPTTVTFNIIITDRFRRFAEQSPELYLGTELETGYMPVYTHRDNIPRLFREFGSDFIGFFPKILSPVDAQANDGAGITPVIAHPYLNLSGKGVLIGIIDTGIDYTQSVFRHEDGTSKIVSIWDQTIEGDRPPDLYFGSEYTRTQINTALQTENPFAIVPSTDTDGHGTFLASVAAGSRTADYIGAAPGAELVVVKLRRADSFYIEKYLLPPEEPNLYESSDFILGAKYIFDTAEAMGTPVVLCVGMGSNFAGHDGNTPLESYISQLSQRIGYAVVTAAGNESNAKHHTEGRISRTGATDVISIRVGETMTSFTVSIFGASYDRISIGITSPTGEVINRIPFKVGLEFQETLTIDRTTISIGYYKDVNTIIVVGLHEAKEGIWEIKLYGDSILNGEYHAWLPITGQVSPWVEFMKPVPEYTIVYPANALRAITCGAYNSYNNTLYVSSSWGPTRLPRMAPDFVAPGVNVRGIYPTGPGTMTGTSAAAAITAGAVAILLEWGIVQGNLRSMDGDIIRLLLISGCNRDEGILYPNTRWGYGKLDLYGTFFRIKESSIVYEISGGIQ